MAFNFDNYDLIRHNYFGLRQLIVQPHLFLMLNLVELIISLFNKSPAVPSKAPVMETMLKGPVKAIKKRLNTL